MRPVLARQMENYAGFLEHTDHHVGRLIDALKELQILDDTLVYVIVGDNGASAEGTLQGTFNELIGLNGMGALETPAFLSERIDQIGGPESSPHYAVGWAHAMCTPYQWNKQVASHWGGTRNDTIIRWPARPIRFWMRCEVVRPIGAPGPRLSRNVAALGGLLSSPSSAMPPPSRSKYWPSSPRKVKPARWLSI